MLCVTWFKSQRIFILLFNLPFFQGQPQCITYSSFFSLSGQVPHNNPEEENPFFSFSFTYEFKFSVLKGELDKQYEKVTAVPGRWVSNSLLLEVWIGAAQQQSVELCQCKRGELFQPCVQTPPEIYSPSETKELKVHSHFTYLPRLKFSNSFFQHNK